MAQSMDNTKHRKAMQRWGESLRSEGRILGDSILEYAGQWAADVANLKRERDEIWDECERLQGELKRLREVAHAAHHLICNKHLMCADPDDDGSLAHYMSLLQGALDAWADAAE